MGRIKDFFLKKKKTTSLADEEYRTQRALEEVKYAKERARRDVMAKYSTKKKKKTGGFGGIGDAFGVIAQAGRNFESSNVVGGGFGGGLDYGFGTKTKKRRKRRKKRK